MSLLPSYCPGLARRTPDKALTTFSQTSGSLYCSLPLLHGTGSLLHSRHCVCCCLSSLAPCISGSCCCFSVLGSPSSAPLCTWPLEPESPAALTNVSSKILSLLSNDAPSCNSFRLIFGALLIFLYPVQTSIQSDITAVFLSVSKLFSGRVCGQLIGPSMLPAAFGQ